MTTLVMSLGVLYLAVGVMVFYASYHAVMNHPEVRTAMEDSIKPWQSNLFWVGTMILWPFYLAGFYVWRRRRG